MVDRGIITRRELGLALELSSMSGVTGLAPEGRMLNLTFKEEPRISLPLKVYDFIH